MVDDLHLAQPECLGGDRFLGIHILGADLLSSLDELFLGRRSALEPFDLGLDRRFNAFRFDAREGGCGERPEVGIDVETRA